MIEATVSEDLRTLSGTLTPQGLEGAHWADVLRSLPDPNHELTRIRTYPGKPNSGEITFYWEGGTLIFETDLPKRYGDVGWTHQGLFANGTWYPQPFVNGKLPEAHWEVTVHVPEGTTGAVGNQIAKDTVVWSGEGNRASLAVVKGGYITPFHEEGWTLNLLSRRRPPKSLRKNLRFSLPSIAQNGEPKEVALVVTPMRRRLARPGSELLYISDRSWRVFPWFYHLHNVPILRGILEAGATQPDAFTRSLVAGSQALQLREQVRRDRAKQTKLLKMTKWISLIDAAIYDQEMAFRSEIFQSPFPSDRLSDDLDERFAPHAPPDPIMLQFEAQHGPIALQTFAWSLQHGSSLPSAAKMAGASPEWFTPWMKPYPIQDYTLELQGREVTVTRESPEDAPPEVATLTADGATYQHLMPPGNQTWELTLPAEPKRLVLDPKRALGQTRRFGEVLPPPLRWSLYANISAIQLNRGWVTGFVNLAINRADDTRNRFNITLLTSPSNYLQGRFTWGYGFGPLVRGVTRRNVIRFSISGSWKNPNFEGNLGIRYSLAGSVGMSWDNRVYSLFPMRGTRFGFSVGAGGTPTNAGAFVRGNVFLVGLIDPHPRHVLAGRLTSGVTWTTPGQQRLSLGGIGRVRGLPDGVIQTDYLGVANLEYRFAFIRNASIPLFFTYPSEFQLVAGVDGGVGSDEGELTGAVSVHAGVGVISEHFGLSPGSLMLTTAFPVYAVGFELDEDKVDFEFYLTWGVMF